MRSKALQIDAIDKIVDAFQSCLTDDFRPTVAIVFSSIKHDLQQITQVLDGFNIQIIGCSTAGEICNDNIDENSISILLMDMEESFFKVHFAAYNERTTYQCAYEIGQTAKDCFENPAIILLSGGLTIDAEQIIFGIKDATKDNIPLYGGLAADDLAFSATYVFTNGKVSDQGLLALIIDQDKIQVQGMATSGWEPMGGVNVITKAEGNIVYSINDEPALDVFIRYFGFFDNGGIKEGTQLNTISGQYPLQIIRDEGHSVLRIPMMVNETDRSLILAGGVREGDEFRFSISPGFMVIDQTIEEFKWLNEKAPDVDAVLLFSCMARLAALGPLLKDEIEGIYKYWNTSMGGFLTYGEFGNVANGTCEFHNETCSLVVFKER